MTLSRRPASTVVVGTVAIGILIGLVMGVAWWWAAPTEQWIVVDHGLVPATLTAAGWFAADGWFLILGVVGGLLLTGIAWLRFGQHPVWLVAAVVVGSSLLSVVAWVVGVALGPPDPHAAAAGMTAGATVDGALQLRAKGVLAAPAVGALALLALLLATSSVTETQPPAPAQSQVSSSS